MPKLNITLIGGEEEIDMPISDEEAQAIKSGFAAGSPFTFYDDEGTWVWLNPDAFANVFIEED